MVPASTLQGRHCVVLVLVCLPTALPYTPTITSDGPRSAPWADEDQAPGVQPRPLAGGRRCSARTDHRLITCPAGGPEAGYFRSQQLFLLWPPMVLFFFSHPCIYGLGTAVGVLNSFLRAYPSIVRCDGRCSWFLMDVSSTRRGHDTENQHTIATRTIVTSLITAVVHAQLD